MTEIFNNEIQSSYFEDTNNSVGISNAKNFEQKILNGEYPEELGSSWINLITKTIIDEEYGSYTYQVLSVYFNDLYPAGSVIESEDPIINNYPQDYPEAYISWGVPSYIIGEIYVKPKYRRSGIGTTICLMAAVYIGQQGGEIVVPTSSNSLIPKLLDNINTNYGQRIPFPLYLCPASYVYSAFERIPYSEAEEMFSDNA